MQESRLLRYLVAVYSADGKIIAPQLAGAINRGGGGCAQKCGACVFWRSGSGGGRRKASQRGHMQC